MRKRALTAALLEGIREANLDYQQASGGSWLSDYGAESFLVVHLLKRGLAVARESSARACATMEESFSAITECSGAAKKPGPLPAVLDGAFRADIVLWKDDERPFAVVEVKRKWDAGLCLDDVRRLEALMDRCGNDQSGTIQCACLAVFVAHARDPRGEKLTAHYEHIKKYLIDKGVRRFRFHTLTPQQYSHKGREDLSHFSEGGVLVEFY